ncbi:curlin repeat-containing protein [Fodinibius sp. AD559]|uniref:curlin repeat-containing protein n=1 Tax=Fodinibius sp. AD559 TaxID=3424179 RepID=UPI004046A7C2
MKLRKLLITVFVVLFVGFGSAFAQEENIDGPFSENKVEEINNPGIEYNEAQKEFGIRHFLTSSIEREDTPGDGGNVAIIEQVGDNNVANLTQTGENIYGAIIQHGSNHKAFLNQDGNNLRSVINMQGSSHYLDFDQKVNNRDTFFDFKGSGLEYTATQIPMGGNETQFTLTPKNAGSPAIQITTDKMRVPVIISNN